MPDLCAICGGTLVPLQAVSGGAALVNCAICKKLSFRRRQEPRGVEWRDSVAYPGVEVAGEILDAR